DLSAISGIRMINAFALGGHIMGISNRLTEPWAMYSIDMDTFAVREVPAFFYGFDPKPRDFRAPVVVLDGIAYLWLRFEGQMAAGTFEKSGCHWKI
ncbi:hypothetical protein PENTCL1PPCAC_29145, partial [Pristionchus entomophagus]